MKKRKTHKAKNLIRRSRKGKCMIPVAKALFGDFQIQVEGGKRRQATIGDTLQRDELLSLFSRFSDLPRGHLATVQWIGQKRRLLNALGANTELLTGAGLASFQLTAVGGGEIRFCKVWEDRMVYRHRPQEVHSKVMLAAKEMNDAVDDLPEDEHKARLSLAVCKTMGMLAKEATRYVVAVEHARQKLIMPSDDRIIAA